MELIDKTINESKQGKALILDSNSDKNSKKLYLENLVLKAERSAHSHPATKTTKIITCAKTKGDKNTKVEAKNAANIVAVIRRGLSI